MRIGSTGISNDGGLAFVAAPENHAPVAADSRLAAEEDGAAMTTGVLANDVDSGDDPTTLSYAITSGPGEGTATSNGDGTFT